MADGHRAEERDSLHGPWPTEIEVLQSEFPDVEISRELREDGTHGDWWARPEIGAPMKAATCEELRRLLEEQP